MGGMLKTWADKLVRISAGVALLLLLAAEEKVCPWLLVPPTQPDASQGAVDAGTLPEAPLPGDDTAGDQSPDESSRRPLSLSGLFPDVVPARRTSNVDRAAFEEAIGRREGTVACGPLHVTHGADQFAPPALTRPIAAWRAALLPQPLLGAAVARDGLRTIRDPAIQTILLQTGPPLS